MRVFFICFFLFHVSYPALSQCCSSGCSLSGTKNFGVLEKKHLQIISFYKHSYSDTYYKNDSPVEFLYLKNSFFDYSGFNISYGLSNRFTAEADIGYYISKSQNYYLNNYRLEGNGLSDLALLLKYNLFNAADSVFCLTVSGGGKIPTGSWQEYSKDNVKLPRDVQSGTGAYAVAGGVNIKIKLSPKVSFLFASKTEWNTANPETYQYGISTANSVSSSIRLYRGVSFFAMIKNENRSRDSYGKDKIDFSGYMKLLASPGVIASFENEWEFGLYADLPLYQKYNGTQFGSRYAFSISLSKQFELHSKEEAH